MAMHLTGERIHLRLLRPSDGAAMLELHRRNRDFWQKYTALKDASFYTLEAQTENIKKALEQKEKDQCYSSGVFLKEDDELIGYLNLSEILRDNLQSCFIGYCLDQRHNGKGCMTEAVRLAVGFAFRELKLHRIEAGVMPRNPGSIRVLEKAGFVKEGIARKNVKINGKWEDHQMLAILSDDVD